MVAVPDIFDDPLPCAESSAWQSNAPRGHTQRLQHLRLIALAWLLAQKAYIVPIPGTRRRQRSNKTLAQHRSNSLPRISAKSMQPEATSVSTGRGGRRAAQAAPIPRNAPMTIPTAVIVQL